MVIHHPKDGHPPEGSKLQTRNLATAMDGHLPFLGWSPANLRMVNHRREVDYRRGKLKTGDNCHGWSHNIIGWSPTNQRMVTNQKDINYILGIWHLDLTYKTKTR